MLNRPHKPSSTPLLPRGVRRALEAMRANVGRDWSVVDLAAVAGVSSSTLQRQFQIFLGKTPGAALRDIRFESARRELLQGLPDAKVMDVALRCGFPHCGRFSIEYRRRYGETPSQTLKRQAMFVGALASMPAIIRRRAATVRRWPWGRSRRDRRTARSPAASPTSSRPR